MGELIELEDYKTNVRSCCNICSYKGDDDVFGFIICKNAKSDSCGEVVMADAVCPYFLRK